MPTREWLSSSPAVWRTSKSHEIDENLVREAICELANQMIGNAVTTLNDQGFHFHVRPPTHHTAEQGSRSSEDTEALVMCFNTSSGNVFMNVALRHHSRQERNALAIAG